MFCCGGAFSTGRARLEDYFEAELSVEGFASAYARGSVIVADGVGEGEVAANVYKAASGRCEIIAVEEVEHLGAELNVNPLFDLRVFEDGEIDVRVARAVVSVAASRTKGTWGGINEGRGVKPIGIGLLSLETPSDRADLHSAVIIFVGSADVAGGMNSEWLAAVEAKQRV